MHTNYAEAQTAMATLAMMLTALSVERKAHGKGHETSSKIRSECSFANGSQASVL